MQNLKVFIWQGAWQGGAESVMYGIAQFLREHHNIHPTLGLFKGEATPNQPFEQIEVPRLLPKKLVGYNQIIASILLGNRLNRFDLVITHCGGFWKKRHNHFVYREPGDLDAMMRSLPLHSKVVYWLPYRIALFSLRRADIVVAASHRAVELMRRHHIIRYLPSTNFIDSGKLPLPRQKTYDPAQGPLKLVFIGRDDPIKQLAMVKSSVRQLFNRVELHIFGMAGRSESNIIYHGWQTPKQIEEFLSHSAHLFILASRFEASPLSLLTALALGVPAVCYEAAVPAELSGCVTIFTTSHTLIQTISQIQEKYDDYASAAIHQASEIREKYNKNTVLETEWQTVLHQLSI